MKQTIFTKQIITAAALAGLLVATTAAQPLPAASILPVPFFHDYWGTAPTAGMMVLAYLDAHGYPDLIPGEASRQTPFIDDLIASPEHIADFAHPLDTPGHILPDRSESSQPFTPDGSLANLMLTSQSAVQNAAGYTSLSDTWYGVERWAQAHQPGFQFDACYGHFCDTRLDILDGQVPADRVFETVRASLDKGLPLVAVKGRVGDAGLSTDSFIVVVGYETAPKPRLAFQDPKDTSMTLHWGELATDRDADDLGAVLYFRPLNVP